MPSRGPRQICSPKGLDLDGEALRTFWRVLEPAAGKGTQVLWLGDDLERASRFVEDIAPLSRVTSSDQLNPDLRAIVVFQSTSRPQAQLLGPAFRDACLDLYRQPRRIRRPYHYWRKRSAHAPHRTFRVLELQHLLLENASNALGIPALSRF